MTTAMLTAPSTPRELADELYALLVNLDPVLFSLDAAEAARRALARIRDGAYKLLQQARSTPLNAAEARLWAAVGELHAALPDPTGLIGLPEFTAFYERTWPLYDALVDALAQEGERVQRLRPTNWLRSFVHVALGVAIALAYELLLNPTTAILAASGWVLWAWSLEGARKFSPPINRLCMKFFGPIARDHEVNHVNSATWFGTGLFLLALLLPPIPSVLGLIAVSVGDPFAGAVGRKFGRTKLYQGRSLEGSAAFAAAAFVAEFAWLLLFHGELSLGTALALSACAAVAGSVTEHLSTIVDDNLAVPLGAAAITTIFAAFLG